VATDDESVSSRASTPASGRDGLLLVDKAPGITSHDVVDRFRRRTRIKKVGHTGTLDPLATGLLMLCVGRTTRLQSYLMGMEKTYMGEIQFGWATDSYDATGEPASAPEAVDVSTIDFPALVIPFTGELDQMPPQFSAKKVGGVRAYEAARKGETVALTTKKVTVHEFSILGVESSVVRFRVRSSAGTYVRSLAHELGIAAGVPAHLKSLRREAIGGFKASDAIPFDRMREASVDELLAPPHFQTLDDIDLPLQKLRVDFTQEAKLLQGQSVIMIPGVPVKRGELVALGNPKDELVAIAEVVHVLREGGPVEMKPKVVLKKE
jgi:tRNA pseudouridine55 synthase